MINTSILTCVSSFDSLFTSVCYPPSPCPSPVHAVGGATGISCSGNRMVTRNPNLLAVRPTGFGGAANAKSDTMQMSYVIAATRPLGPVLLFGLAFCLAIPLVEIGTGISREQILSAIISGGN
ncbi:unnamed protein product [Ectocarpus sp. 13 AM-2016]